MRAVGCVEEATRSSSATARRGGDVGQHLPPGAGWMAATAWTAATAAAMAL